jgi:hypothetical protein
MRKMLVPLFILVFGLAVFGQSDKLQPNQWKGLVIDKSKSAEVLEKFGKPKTDKTDKLFILKRKWVTNKLGDKQWRVVHYEGIEGFKDVKFVFSNQDSLVIIQLEPKNLTAQAFSGAYDISVKPYFSGLDEAFFPKDFERNQGKVYAKSYPDQYEIIGVNDKVFVFAGITNVSIGNVFKKGLGVGDAEGNYPGKVYMIQLISKSLENKDNVDVLK